jgi:hypothetical protein
MGSNNFYKAVELIRSRLENNPLVNTVIFAKTNEKDLYKKQIYPIAHIVPTSSPFSTKQVTEHTFEIGVMAQRDIPSVKKNTKFEGDDNVIDNLNTCYAILTDLVNYLYNRNVNLDDRIELVSVSDFTPLLFTDFNILDGWVISITLMIPNDDICYE